MNLLKWGKITYIVGVVVSFVVSYIAQKIFDVYFDIEVLTKFLDYPILVKQLFPWVIAIVWVFICVVANQLEKRAQRIDGDMIETMLKNAVDEFDYVESMQAYHYFCKNDSESAYYKVSYVAAVADEGININVVLQTYFYLPWKFQRQIKLVRTSYNRYIRATDVEEKKFLKVAFQLAGKALCDDILTTLEKIKNPAEISKYHCEMYRVLSRIMPAIYENPVERLLGNEAVESALLKNKKTGILGAVCLDDIYIFKNESSMSKSSRTYFSFHLEKYKKVVFLASMNAANFPECGKEDIAKYCEYIVSNLTGSEGKEKMK